MRETRETEDGGGNTSVVEPNRLAVSKERRHGDGAKTDPSRWSSVKLQVLVAAEHRKETREKGTTRERESEGLRLIEKTLQTRQRETRA